MLFLANSNHSEMVFLLATAGTHAHMWDWLTFNYSSLQQRLVSGEKKLIVGFSLFMGFVWTVRQWCNLRQGCRVYVKIWTLAGVRN